MTEPTTRERFRWRIIALLLIVAATSFMLGMYINRNENPADRLEAAAKNYPSSLQGESGQWFMMKSLVGWERMMFIFGYADDKEVCEHLVEVASVESPEREFRCDDAN